MRGSPVTLRRFDLHARRYNVRLYLQLLLFSFAFDGYSAETFDAKRLANESIPAVATVEARGESGEVITRGSGFLISPAGILVTNQHVIKEAHNVVTHFENGASISAEKVIGFDCDSDIVVLQLDTRSTSLPFLRLAATEEIQVGERVIAIGSPVGLSATVSTGIISGIRRDSNTGVRILQTTAAISPGSSGGPLIRTGTQVIGVTTSGLNVGQSLNFAVPTEYIVSVLRKPSPVGIETAGAACKSSIRSTQVNPGQSNISAEQVFEYINDTLATTIALHCNALARTEKDYLGCLNSQFANVRRLLVNLSKKTKTSAHAAKILLNCDNSWSRRGASWNFAYFDHCIRIEITRYRRRGYKVE